MGSILNSTCWVPESLASCWDAIPIRLGYAVDPASDDLARAHWEAQAAGESRRIKDGYTKKGKPIDASLIENVIALDHSASIVTGGTVIDVTISQDLFQIYDSTRSWWADMSVCGSRNRFLRGYGSYVEYRQSHSDLVMSTLCFAFIVSGAEFAYPKPFEQGLGWERGQYRDSTRLLTCPLELAATWPQQLLSTASDWHFIPLCPTPYPSKERYVSGSIRKAFGGVRIYSGPALDPANKGAAAFLAIEPYGYFARVGLADELVNKALECEATLVYKPSNSRDLARDPPS